MGKSRLTSRRRQEQGLRWARISMAVLATIGFIDTASITLSRWGLISSLSCLGGENGCDKVLNSPWGTIFSFGDFTLPLSFVGAISYFAVIIMTILPLLPGISENKLNLSRKTWWSLFAITCAMTVFSIVLLNIMIFKIEALCLFCILSACISLILFLLTIIGGGWEDRRDLIFRGIIFSLAILISSLVWASAVDAQKEDFIAREQGLAPAVTSKSNQSKIDLAKHLARKGVYVYSAYWCPHCHEQKEMFGKEASAELLSIECAKDGKDSQYSLCEEKGIEAYPSWEINGRIEGGVKSLRELSEITEFKGTKDFR